MEIVNQLLSNGYSIRNKRYLQKKLSNGWYIDVDVKRGEVTALNYAAQLKQRDNHMCYDWERTNHTVLKERAGVKIVKNYVRNEEAKRVPQHMITGWVELLEKRLS